MRHCSKRNKAKVWRKTYGKPFIARRAFRLAQASMSAAVAASQVGFIAASCGNQLARCAAIANATVSGLVAMNKILADSSAGFVNKMK